MRYSSALFAGLAVCALALPARAQQRFDPQFFHPTPAQRVNPAGMYSADVLPDGAFEIGVLAHYDSAPLVIRNADSDRIYSIVGQQASLHIMGGFGLFNLLDLTADLPIILYQSGDFIPPIPNFDVDASDAQVGVGDARLALKFQFFTTHTAQTPGGVALAAIVEGFFPIGDDSVFQGEDWRVAPRLSFDGVLSDGHRITLSAGYTYRQETQIAGLEVGPTFDWGAAVHFRSQYVHVIPEFRGSLVTTAEDLALEEIPMEANLTFRILPIEQLMIEAGGGMGLAQGFGAPEFRVMFGASWLQIPPGDRDRDGIANPDDQCPDEPEDRDEFEDENGCPDPDNDQDQILDEPDECPNVAEDRDEHEDQDGCVDPDNDGDGILDTPDQCPNEREDADGFNDSDGCPEPDNDEDGMIDSIDGCPIQAEDRDEFEDTDGCPEPDNDNDGFLDGDDRCPNDPEDRNGVHDDDGCPERDTDGDRILDPEDQCVREPEDYDRFQDTDGCPDPDNDADNILDVNDRCPNEPEVVNGVRDDDGCPDQGAITVTCRAIEIRDTIYFQTDQAVIQSRSFNLLSQIAAVMGARPDIRRISIEGHTDDRGGDAHNLDLSTRRAQAVRDHLVSAGIAAERLTSQGFGESRPIQSNRTGRGRAANRRVEFVILEQEGCRDQPAVP
jgi:outer membrane protein OmpA-like peptidoglycan-associated protein